MAHEDDAKWRELLRCANGIDPVRGGDLATEAWISLRGRFAGQDARYLTGAVRNLHRSHRRRDERRARRERDWSAAMDRSVVDPLDELEHRDRLDAARRALQKLDGRELRLLQDRYVAGRTSKP